MDFWKRLLDRILGMELRYKVPSFRKRRSILSNCQRRGAQSHGFLARINSSGLSIVGIGYLVSWFLGNERLSRSAWLRMTDDFDLPLF